MKEIFEPKMYIEKEGQERRSKLLDILSQEPFFVLCAKKRVSLLWPLMDAKLVANKLIIDESQ